MNGYELHSLDRISEDAFADIFQEICQRGNPLLQGRPKDQLLHLGRLMYWQALQDPLSIVVTTGDAEQVVAISTAWDMQAGSLWKGLEVPEALRGHAAVAAACCASAPLGAVQFAAFIGVKRGYPKELLIPCLIFGVLGGARMGYDYRFGYTVHPSLLAWMAEDKATRHERGFKIEDQIWELPFSGMEAENDVIKELCALKPNCATCTLKDLRVIRDHYDLVLSTLDTNTRPLFERLDPVVQLHLKSKGVPFVDQFGMAPAMQLSAVAVLSKL